MPMTFSHTPGEWDGTFEKVITILLEDLLSDGEGVSAEVTWDARDGWPLMERVLILHLGDGEMWVATRDRTEATIELGLVRSISVL